MEVATAMKVLDGEALREQARAAGLPWADDDDELRWREALRAHVAAEGSVRRRSLVDRVLRTAGTDDSALRERLHTLVDDLDAVGDVYLGDGGLVGAAPLRAAQVRGSDTVLWLGSVPTATLEAALPGERIERRRVRRSVLGLHDADALRCAVDALGGRVLDAEAWAGLDRAPSTLSEWRVTLDARRGEPALDEEAWEVFAPGPRSRWLRTRESGPTPRLVRVRQAGGWYRHAWQGEGGVVALTRDEAARTALALEAEAGVAQVVRVEPTDDGRVAFGLTAWLPRAEYRMLVGAADQVGREGGASRYVSDATVWMSLKQMLCARLAMRVEEAGR
jgi:hypothetical protein